MDKKLTDAEIVKALDKLYNTSITATATDLEVLDAKGLRRFGFFIKAVIDLINRLQAENKKFKDRQKPTGASGYKIENGKVVFFTNMLGGCKIVKENLEEVVKTLNELLQECYSKYEIEFALKRKTEELKTAKAEAYKEFAERLKEKTYYSSVSNARIISVGGIDNLLKELVGE